MMIIGVTTPAGEKHHIAAALASAGSRDDICRMHVGTDGRLWAANPAVETVAPDEPVWDWRGRRVTAPRFEEPHGVPISAILLGGHGARVAPLVYEARDWAHGVYVRATLLSETTAAPTREMSVSRNDNLAMLPFCGYNMGEYLGHWLSMGRRLVTQPRIFHVNWSRTGDDGKLLWPGFGDNIRVLEWILERVSGRGAARTTPIGNVPTSDAIDVRGLDLSQAQLDALLAVDPQAWLAEVQQSETFLRSLGARLPAAVAAEHNALRDRLRASIS